MQIFKNMPSKLQYEFLVCLYKDLIMECPFFNSYDTSFIIRMIPLVRPINFSKGEFVWRSGEYSSNVFFIKKGELKCVIEYEHYDKTKPHKIYKKKIVIEDHKNHNEHLQSLKDIYSPEKDKILAFKGMTNGSYFGEEDILLPRRRIYSVIAREETQAYYLSRIDFENVLMNEFPHILKELRHLCMKKEAKNQNLMKQALHNYQNNLQLEKSVNGDLFGNESSSSSSDTEHQFIPQLEQFFDEAKDSFPLEDMVNQTNFKALDKILDKQKKSKSDDSDSGENNSESKTES